MFEGHYVVCVWGVGGGAGEGERLGRGVGRREERWALKFSNSANEFIFLTVQQFISQTKRFSTQ